MKWMLTCAEAAQLISESLDYPLPWWKRRLLKLHLSMCERCPEYARQLEILHQVFHQMQGKVEGNEALQLSEEAKRRIKVALEQLLAEP